MWHQGTLFLSPHFQCRLPQFLQRTESIQLIPFTCAPPFPQRSTLKHDYMPLGDLPLLQSRLTKRENLEVFQSYQETFAVRAVMHLHVQTCASPCAEHPARSADIPHPVNYQPYCVSSADNPLPSAWTGPKPSRVDAMQEVQPAKGLRIQQHSAVPKQCHPATKSLGKYKRSQSNSRAYARHAEP
jgi:hypothetical protein